MCPLLRQMTSKMCTGYLADSSCCLASTLAASSCCAPFCMSASSRSWLCSAALQHVLRIARDCDHITPVLHPCNVLAAVVRIKMSGRVLAISWLHDCEVWG